ncbi:MAG: hypothetical protein JXB32_08005 [Deltaproteobacteria bacterium]|nr:hypothetical protein [Deltaproteobacteria bacterium]
MLPLLCALLAALPACGPSRSTTGGAPDGAGPPAATEVATTDAPAGPDVAAARVDVASVFREESARWIPEPYDDLYLGEPLAQVLEDYPEARPYVSPADPERLEWYELQGVRGLVLRLGFGTAGAPEAKRLRSVQFLSLLQGSVPADAPAEPRALAAWQEWISRTYGPHIQGLREKYGERADVYSCAGSGEHPVVRLVWRGEAVAVTAAFLLHEKGLSSTLMFTPLDVADRYIKATQCRWLQDRVL